MKFLEAFMAARKVSTPIVKVATPDAASTIKGIRTALDVRYAEHVASKEKVENPPKPASDTPMLTWDAVHGLKGLNEKGQKALANMLSQTGAEPGATNIASIALGVLEAAVEDVIAFVYNAHLFWADPVVIQGIWNVRDGYKTNGNMLVLLTNLGIELPAELSNDVLSLEEPLPTRAEIHAIIKETFEHANCSKHLTDDILRQASDALVGLAAFPSEQTTAMCLNKKTGKLDIKTMWERKKAIVSATPGLSFADEPLTLADAGGLANVKAYVTRLIKGKRGCGLILRMDEIEKMFAGNGSDSSGVKTELLGNFLTWVVDKKVICMLFLGVPGAAKSHLIYCVGGHFKIPVVNFGLADMQDKHVGTSGQNLRTAERTVEAISDGQIILIATANSLRGLPPELISRFEKGGIFFFDTPDTDERKQVLDIKTKQYSLDASQLASVPDTEGWTGREIDSMCDKADNLTLTCGEASKYVVPLTTSHAEMVNELRQSASNRFLSASYEGKYQYKPKEVVHTSTVTTGRKMRD